MNYYYFPIVEGFESSVTLVNSPAVEKKEFKKGKQFIYVTWAENNKWHYRKIGEIKYNETVTVNYSELPPSISSSPFIFYYHKDLPPTSDTIIISDHMQLKPSWRGNIKISSHATATSYQGEYQHEMVKYIKKGSMVSVSPMLQMHPDIINYFVLVNVDKNPAIKEHLLYFFDPIRRKILHEDKLYNNTTNVLKIPDIDMPTDTPILAISKTIAGIPIYLSQTKDNQMLSFEHTHPPASMVVFGEPLYFQRRLKDYWINELERGILNA